MLIELGGNSQGNACTTCIISGLCQEGPLAGCQDAFSFLQLPEQSAVA